MIMGKNRWKAGCILPGVLACVILLFGGTKALAGSRPDTVLIGVGAKPTAFGIEASDEKEEAITEGSAVSTDTNQASGEEDEEWKLILVNHAHPIPADYEVGELTQLQNGNSIDSRVYPALQRMFDDARAQGLYPYVTSSYRTREKQQELMDQKVNEYLASGYSQEEAEALAREWVAVPGTSEHELGLSADISADPASGQDPGAVWYWLEENCWTYGFIRRYPEDKTQITGIINEPWHFRYVGETAAAAMHESGQCLEEYLGILD